MKKWQKYTKEEIIVFYNKAQTREDFLKLIGYKNYNTSNFNQIKEAFPELDFDKFSFRKNIKYDLVGKKFGRLTVIEREYYRKNNDKKGGTYWKCKCDCGQYVIVKQNCLLQNQTKSCGCLRSEKTRLNTFKNKRKIKDIKGQIFNTLKAIEPTEERRNGHLVWKCECQKCGKISYHSVNNLQDKQSNCICNKISSKGEKKVKEILDKMNLEYKREYSFPEVKNIKPLRFDFVLFEKDKIIGIIEYQGIQHYQPRKCWGGEKEFEYTVNNDNIKRKFIKEKNYPYLEIPYTDLEKIDESYIKQGLQIN